MRLTHRKYGPNPLQDSSGYRAPALAQTTIVPHGMPIASLLGLAKSKRPDARRRAVARLVELSDMRALNTTESQAFAEALWSQIDQATGLPADTGFHTFAFLILPEAVPGNARRQFRQLMLGRNFTRVIQRSIADDGKVTKTMSGGLLSDPFVLDLLHGTASLVRSEDEEMLVDWTAEEAVQLFNKVIAWWDEEKVEFTDPGRWDFSISSFRERLASLVPVLAEVILPRLDGNESEVVETAERLCKEMDSCGFVTVALLPAMLHLTPDRRAETAQRLRSALNSMTEPEVSATIRGIIHWQIYHGRQLAPAPPPDLLNELVNRVLSRRQPGLKAATGDLTTRFRWRPELLTADNRESLCIALEYLAAETELPVGQDMGEAKHSYGPIDLEDRPEYRRLAAELAYALSESLPDKSTVPASLVRWEQICHEDVLPEVRRAWRPRVLIQ